MLAEALLTVKNCYGVRLIVTPQVCKWFLQLGDQNNNLKKAWF